ncbi:hypothetical protein BJX66DRAFT_135295 [Aspergillus keveii]|uniref:Secreted protein n=1 Tax=Aspergillus keveii TaxID=714993 RepID=A0ABR4GBJ2_9EURO
MRTARLVHALFFRHSFFGQTNFSLSWVILLIRNHILSVEVANHKSSRPLIHQSATNRKATS